jgi:hypothetical protein
LQFGLVDDLDSQDRLVAGRLDDNALQRLGEALGDLASNHDPVGDGDPT